MNEIKVILVKIGNNPAYGITCNKRWFFYAYTEKSKAERIVNNPDIRNKLIANIAYTQPLQIVK